MDIATAQFERALVLFRSGNDRLANQAAKAVLDCAPDHVGGMMLLLATAGGCGDDDTINEALLTISEHYPRLLAIPEVLDLLQSDLMAPVVRSQAFRTVFAPSLRVARGQLCDDADRQMARLVVQEAVRDATVEAALAGAPAFPEPRPDAGGALHLVDPSTGTSVGSLDGGGEYLLGRAGQIIVDHPSVSRRHLALTRRGGAWFARNVSRTNPGLLNGLPMGQGWSPIRDGDELKLGRVSLCVVAGENVFSPPVEMEEDPDAACYQSTLQSLTPPPPPRASREDLVDKALAEQWSHPSLLPE